MTTTIGRHLSYSSCVNRCFLRKELDGHVCSETDHDFDLGKAEAFFKELRIPHNFNSSVEAIKKLLINLSDRPSIRIEMLRLYLILPCCLYVDIKMYNDGVVSSLASLLSKLDENNKIILGRWLKSIPSKFFNRYVWFFKMFVIKALNRLQSVNDDFKISKERTDVENCIEVLDMLNEINHCRHKPIPCDRFHVSELINKINIVGDFELWFQDRVKEKTSKKFRFCKYPFLYNSASKFLLLKCQCEKSMELHKRFEMLTFNHLKDVRRDHIIEDTRRLLSEDQKVLRHRFEVNFKDETPYPGVGIRQEFFQVILKELLDPVFGVFRYYEEKSNTQWFVKDSNPDDIYFIGLICGLALYNGVTLNLDFPLALYKKLLNKPLTLTDLRDLKPRVYKSLEYMLSYDFEDFEDSFCDIYFEAAHLINLNESVELCNNGSNIQLTQHNRLDYANRMKDYYLNTSIEKEFEKFYKGFCTGIPQDLWSSFDPQELKEVLVGEEGDERYDFKCLEKVTEYDGDYSKNHETIIYFWEVFHEMDLDKKKAFLVFLTGSSQIPAYGINMMKITVSPREDHKKDPDKLMPHAITCFNHLKLPRYTNKDSLKNMILCALAFPTGFTLLE